MNEFITYGQEEPGGFATATEPDQLIDSVGFRLKIMRGREGKGENIVYIYVLIV